MNDNAALVLMAFLLMLGTPSSCTTRVALIKDRTPWENIVIILDRVANEPKREVK